MPTRRLSALVLAGLVLLRSRRCRGGAAARLPFAGGRRVYEAVKLHDSGKFAEAIPLFKQAIAQGFQPVNQARFRLARAYARAGRSNSHSRSSKRSRPPASPTPRSWR